MTWVWLGLGAVTLLSAWGVIVGMVMAQQVVYVSDCLDVARSEVALLRATIVELSEQLDAVASSAAAKPRPSGDLLEPSAN